MTRWSKLVIFAVFAAGLLLTGQGWGFYVGGPFKGRVIDAETKQPLEGAAVLAVWNRVVPTLADQIDFYLDAEEVLTDKNGRFIVGKNPPKIIGIGWVEGPYITIYYLGYGFYPRYQVSPALGLYNALDVQLKTMEREEMTIELPRLKTREERIRVQGGVINDDVPDEKIPNLLRLLNLERKSLGFAPTHTK